MKLPLLILFLLSEAMASETNGVAAPSTNTAPATGFAAFKILAERNIFDPNRAAPGVPRVDEAPAPKPAQIDYLTLVGSMSYEKGDFAFFDSSKSEYRKAVKAGDSIAGYKVGAVMHHQVTLQTETNKIDLPVGAQLKRVDEGEWKLNLEAEKFTSAQSATSSNGERDRKSDRSDRDRSDRDRSSSRSERTERTEKPVSAGDESEALKRLMERRAKEK